MHVDRLRQRLDRRNPADSVAEQCTERRIGYDFRPPRLRQIIATRRGLQPRADDINFGHFSGAIIQIGDAFELFGRRKTLLRRHPLRSC